MAQHARTTQLLGVDFLPLGRAPASIGAQPQSPDEKQEREAARERSPGYVEAKPDGAVSVVGEPDVREEIRRGSDSPGDGALVSPVSIMDLRAAYEHLRDPAARLEALRKKYEHDAPHRHFNTGFKSIVFGEGAPDADLMFVGEAPGEQEDLTGRPFVGRAGQLLEKMIVAMGLGRETVYLCNVLKTRPPGNATPTQREAALCAPYLHEQIRIISPKVIVALGLAASHLLLGTTSPMRSLRGRWHQFPPGSGVFAPEGGLKGAEAGGQSGDDGGLTVVRVMPTYHPAYLLRSYTEENRRDVWSDLKQVMDVLGSNPQ